MTETKTDLKNGSESTEIIASQRTPIKFLFDRTYVQQAAS